MKLLLDQRYRNRHRSTDIAKTFYKICYKIYNRRRTGLGLFISKSIIEMHGGKIWATNNDEIDREKGVGSTFTFSLPVKQ